jgi:hypothetical protein
MSLKSFCLKYKRPLCLFVVLILAFISFKMSDSIKEGIDNAIDWTKLSAVKTSCPTDGKTCDLCTKSYFKGSSTSDNIRCAWNTESSSGGSCESSTKDTKIGFFSCPTTDGPVTKPGCTACAKTVLLDTPTFMTVA